MLERDRDYLGKGKKLLTKKYSLKSSNIVKNGRRLYKENSLHRCQNDLIKISIIIYIININLFISIKSNENINRKLNSQYSYITLKINKKGNFYVFQTGKYPDEIYINEENKTIITRQYTFTQTNNTVKLVWLEPITSAKEMFAYKEDIEEIDLSNFDASKIADMSFMFHNCKSLKFVNLTNLNATIVKNMNRMFLYCEKLEYINISNINIPQVKNMGYMFARCYSLKELDLSNIKIEEATEMYYMFDWCSSLTFIDFSNFNSSVKNMSYMFNYCKKLSSLNFTGFNTSQVTDMEGIFYECNELKSLDLSSFDTSRVINMNKMFYGCTKLEELNLSNFNTEQVKSMIDMFFCNKLTTLDISHFNTSQVTSFRGMFTCKSLVSLDILHFDTSKATNIGHMFSGCSSLTSLNISNFDTSQVDSMDFLFSSCDNLNYLDLSNFNTAKVKTMEGLFKSCKKIYSINLSSFDTSKVENMRSMFYSCFNLTYLNITHFETSQVTTMASMFYGFYNFDKIDISNFDTSKVVEMQEMFKNCNTLTSLNLFHFDTSNVVNMEGMFQNCNTLTSLNISNFDTSNVVDMSHLFDGCMNITSFDLSNFKTSNLKNMAYMFNNCTIITSLDFSNFDTSLVTNMGYMFYNCKYLINLNISNFITSKLTNMEYMFYNCSNLTSLDLTFFNTSLVTCMRYMFYNCKNLIILNISNFITKNIQYMEFMFYNCSNLTSLDLSNFEIAEAINMNSMFSNCEKLNYLNISNFGISKVTNMEKMFYNCHSLNSLDLSRFSSNTINNLKKMFELCSSLGFMNLENFDKGNNYIGLSITSNIILCSKYYSWGNEVYIGKNLTINCIEDEINIKENRCYYNFHNIRYNRFICNVCGYNYYQKYNDTNNNMSYSNCYNKVNGYYLNKEAEPIFKPCYSNCKTCDKEGNELYHNCIECKDGYKSKITFDNYSNCYNETENMTELITNNILYLTDTFNESISVIKESNKIINSSNYIDESISTVELNNITEIFSYLLNDYNSSEIIINSIEENNYETTNKFIELNYTQFNYNNKNLTEIIETDTIKKTFKDNMSEMLIDYNNMKSNELNQIDFSTQNKIIEEDLIHISNKSEYIQKIKENLINKLQSQNNIFAQDLEEGMENILVTLSTTKLQKINKNENKTTIDLGECENRLKIYYDIPKDNPLYIIKLDVNEEGMNIPKIEYEVYYPFNNSFYHFTKLNLSICEGKKIEISIPVSIREDIEKYNINSDYYNDICSLANSENGIDKTLLERRKEFINNNMTLCEENCKLIEYNYDNKKAGCSCDVKTKISSVENVKFDKKKLFDNFIKIKNFINIKVVKCYKKVFTMKNIKNNIGFFIIISIFILYFITLLIFRYKSFYKLKRKINKFIISQNSQKEIKENNKNNEHQKNDQESILQLKKNRNIEIIKNSRNLNSINFDKVQKEKNDHIYNMESKNENVVTKNKIDYKKFELNFLCYKNAIKYDKRTYIQYYISFLKYNHLLVFLFFNIRDYNSRIIKSFLFFLFFSTYFAINALFFTDEKIHKIYEDKGSFNFINHFPSIIYSSIISGIINTIIKQFALSQKTLIEFKQRKKKKNLDKKVKKFLKKLKIKFILFFIVSFVLLLFFGYYITCFCGIYTNTQIILIENTLISFGLSMVYPFGKYLFPGIFRKIALISKEKNKDCLYKFSILLQLL